MDGIASEPRVRRDMTRSAYILCFGARSIVLN